MIDKDFLLHYIQWIVEYKVSSKILLSWDSRVLTKYNKIAIEFLLDAEANDIPISELTFVIWFKNKYGGNEDENTL